MRPPAWVQQVATEADRVPPAFFAAHRPPGSGRRHSAVLVLLGPDEGDPAGSCVVLTERAARLRSHSGQIAFPGGRVDPTDDGPIDAAFREAHEEIALRRQGVDVVTTFPPVNVPVSDSSVTPVVAWWRAPSPVRVHSPQEVERVVTVPVGELIEPSHRFTVTHPMGYRGVGFETRGLFIWGFTAAVLDRLLVLGGLEQPWDASAMRELPERFSAGRAPMVDDRASSDPRQAGHA